MPEPRNQWIKKRFGNIDEKILGNIEDAKKILWPDIVKEYEVLQKCGTLELTEKAEKLVKTVEELWAGEICT
jgi:imidazole glycerol phosphate synthase subunit HisF